MMSRISSLISKNRRFIPLSATVLLFFIAYAYGFTAFPSMRDPQVFFNLFRNYPFLLISAVGMTFVILTGGIDLSVSGVVALTTVASAALLRSGWNPWVVILLMLLMGMALGGVMGSFIAFLKVQPFIATLAGMWFARGMCFFISDDAIAIKNRTWQILGQTKFLIPGLSDPAAKTGDFISPLVLVALAVIGIAILVAQLTRFGRTVYAVGGNAQSARLMGLPVELTKVAVYTISGFCSALAGLTLSIAVMSGHGLYAQSFELDVIASVVMGGTLLSGGTGYMFGTLFGVLVNVLIQTLIQFQGTLSSWWTKIVIGALTLIFIGVQSQLAARKARLPGEAGAGEVSPLRSFLNRRWKWITAAGVALLTIVMVAFVVQTLQNPGGGSGTGTIAANSGCEDKPFRQEEAAQLMKEPGAVLTYEKNGGPNCIDVLYVIYSDGRIVGDDGTKKIEKQITPDEVQAILKGINDLGWFTDEMYDTWHARCGQCYGYYITISYNDQVKTVKGVDGGTDAPTRYWDSAALIIAVIPKF
jgi:ribose/xylose/arabinose/galactoside ABC-type transport system permease subunit